MNSSHVYIGVDVSKASLQIDPFDHQAPIIPNTSQGLRSLIRRIQADSRALGICCEATGGYERRLITLLTQAGIPVALLHPRRVRKFAESKGVLAKTDAIDARILTWFARENPPRPVLAPTPWSQDLRALLIRRNELVDIRTQEKSRLDPEPMAAIQKLIRAHLEGLDQHINRIEAQLKEMVREHTDLDQLVTRIIRVKSLGLITVLSMIAFVPELGHITDNQAAALVGVAPYNNDSGLHKKKRIIKGGRPRVRRVLYMAAVSASRSNPILRAFYQRLIQQGKPPKVALTALMRKLVVLVNRLVADPEFQLS